MSRLRSAWVRVAPWAAPSIVMLAVVMVMFWRIWTPIVAERRIFGWDVPWQYWGDLRFQVDALRDGALPLWNPYDRLGYPFHADPQAGTLYPVQWLLWALAALTEPGLWLVTVKTILHFWILGVGTYALLARRALPKAACYAGALIVLTSCPVLQNSMSALNWSFAWAPWMMLAGEAWAERPTVDRAGLLALAVSLGFLAGAPATFWYGVLVAAPWTLLAVGTRARAARDRRGYLRAVAISGAALVGFGVALCAAQALATGDLLAESVRAERTLTLFGTTIFDPVDGPGFFLPRAVGQNVYLGWGPILWAGALVALRPSPRALLLVALCALAVLCAIGDRGPALPALASLLTPFTLFRRAHRYLYVMSLPLAVLASEGLALLASVDGDDRLRARRGVVWATVVMVLICGMGFAVKIVAPWRPDAARDAFALGLVVALAGGATTWLVIEHRRRAAGLLVWAAVALAGLDLWMCRFEKIERNLMPPAVMRHDAAVRGLEGVPLEARIYDRGWARFRPGTRLQVRDLGGYEDDPLALERYTRLLEAARRAPRLLAHAGVGYLLEGKDLENADPRLPRSGEDAAAVTAIDGLDGASRVAAPAPMVAWFDRATVARDAGDALAQTLAAPAGQQVSIEAGALAGDERARIERADGAGVASVRGALVALSRNQLRATIDAPGDGVVVIRDAFARGWRARVDGVPARILPADGVFRAVLVGPGHHVIEMEYGALRYLALGALVPLALIAIAVLALRGRRGEEIA